MDRSDPALTVLAYELQRRNGRRASSDGCCSTGIEALNQLLPGQGLKPGGLTEWLAESSEGGFTFALLAASQALKSGRGSVIAIIDPEQRCYPAVLPKWGVPLDQLILIRPRRSPDAFWAWEQSLRCSRVAACVGWLPKASTVALRRLQIAAEEGGGQGLLVRPPQALKEPNWADVRWRVRALASPGGESRRPALRGRRFRVELLKCRGQMSGGVAEVEFPLYAANPVRLVPAVADSTPALRPTGTEAASARPL